MGNGWGYFAAVVMLGVAAGMLWDMVKEIKTDKPGHAVISFIIALACLGSIFWIAQKVMVPHGGL